MFAGELCTMYAPLFGTPAADVVKRLNEKLIDSLTYDSDTDPDIPNASVEELPNGRFRISIMNTAPITEELFRSQEVDEAVNNAIEDLENGIAQGTYKEGSYQRVMVDRILANLNPDKFNNMDVKDNGSKRQIVTDPNKNNIKNNTNTMG